MQTESTRALAEPFSWSAPFSVRKLIEEYVAQGKPKTPEQLNGGLDQSGENILRWMDFGAPFRRATQFLVLLYYSTGGVLANDILLVNTYTDKQFLGIDQVPLAPNSQYELFVQSINLFGTSDKAHKTLLTQRTNDISASVDFTVGDGGNDD